MIGKPSFPTGHSPQSQRRVGASFISTWEFLQSEAAFGCSPKKRGAKKKIRDGFVHPLYKKVKIRSGLTLTREAKGPSGLKYRISKFGP